MAYVGRFENAGSPVHKKRIQIRCPTFDLLSTEKLWYFARS